MYIARAFCFVKGIPKGSRMEDCKRRRGICSFIIFAAYKITHIHRASQYGQFDMYVKSVAVQRREKLPRWLWLKALSGKLCMTSRYHGRVQTKIINS